MSIKSIIKFQISLEEYNQIKAELFNMKDVDNVQIAKSDIITDLVMKLISCKHKRRNCILTILGTVLRVIQLSYKLKFSFSKKHFHPIFVTCCRLLNIVFGLFKLWCNSNDYNYISNSGSHCIVQNKTKKNNMSKLDRDKVKLFMKM